jgi:hypothetical protein
MKLDIFSIPIFIDNIDISKINLKFEKLSNTWLSETKSSYSNTNMLDELSFNYIMDIFFKNLKDFIKKDFKIDLLSIWENKYEKNDFQENHIHPDSDFSFVIYKKCIESQTVFFSPGNYLILSFYKNKLLNNYFERTFSPKLGQGQIILFPSFLEHMVKKSSNYETISGNLKIY